MGHVKVRVCCTSVPQGGALSQAHWSPLAGLFSLRPSHSLLFAVSLSFLARATGLGILLILS